LTADIDIPRHLIEVRTMRSSGPGGQSVNTTESKVEIRFNVFDATWIPQATRDRFAKIFKNRINQSGEFILACQEMRSQNQNYERCFDRLGDMLRQAQQAPKRRVASKPTRASKKRRLDSKKSHSGKKADRRRPVNFD
jgi:ribosome-associated protein